MDHISTRDAFLCAEVRDGVYVDEQLKSVWKVMLDMFEEFVRVCNKYELKYCLDGGSVLGAVRHKGFIPWDDDMDVSLSRSDFQRLLEIAPKEFKHPYFFQYTTTDPQHVQAYACLRNSETSGISQYWVERGAVFNMGIAIDIFPFDELPDDVQQQRWMARVNGIFVRILSYCFALDKGKFWRIKQIVGKLLYRMVGVGRIVKWRDWNLGRFNGKGCRLYGNFALNLGNKKGIFGKETFADRIKVPFEYLDVWIPVGYKTYLSTLYGENWHIPIRGRGDHDPLIVDAQKPYKEVLVEQFGYKPDETRKLEG